LHLGIEGLLVARLFNAVRQLGGIGVVRGGHLLGGLVQLLLVVMGRRLGGLNLGHIVAVGLKLCDCVLQCVDLVLSFALLLFQLFLENKQVIGMF